MFAISWFRSPLLKCLYSIFELNEAFNHDSKLNIAHKVQKVGDLWLKSNLWVVMCNLFSRVGSVGWRGGDRVYFCCNVKARGFLSVMSVCISIFFISHFWSYIERSIKVYGLKCQKIMPYRQHAAFYNFLNSECEYRLIVHNHSLCCNWGSEVV